MTSACIQFLLFKGNAHFPVTVSVPVTSGQSSALQMPMLLHLLVTEWLILARSCLWAEKMQGWVILWQCNWPGVNSDNGIPLLYKRG